MRAYGLAFLATVLFLGCAPPVEEAPAQAVHALEVGDTISFAVIGDYGQAGTPEREVAARVASWNPDFVITVGDNNYPDGQASTIDANVGQYYRSFIYPYVGSYGPGATDNRFFPALGNHDWHTKPPTPYLDYFSLPGNERYYEFVAGPVHFFAVDSDTDEPDGATASSTQGQWLRQALARSTAAWKVVYLHHAPYASSLYNPSTVRMRWPFAEWGADVVLAGHAHHYERLVVAGFPYFVNGIGGKGRGALGTAIPGSQVRYNADFGAMLVDASATFFRLRFITRAGVEIDSYTLGQAPPPEPPAQNQVALTSIKDAWISENAPSTRYGSSIRARIDGNEPEGSNRDAYALFQWDTSAVPPGSTVTAARLTFNVTDSGSLPYEVYELLGDWTESTVTWSTAPARASTVLGAISPTATGSYTVALNPDGVARVQAWVDDPSSNRGILIGDTGNNNGVSVSTREVSTASQRPTLTLEYDAP